MDSAALLDLLGNENRRRILNLLAQRPCYVTEISDYLGVSPKAVIDHLRKLEEAGLIESHVDDQQRKYFYIARNLRLEISVSPYTFGTKSAYPASRSFDITSFRYLSVDVEFGQSDDPRRLVRELTRLQELENELSMLQRWVQGRITEAFDSLMGQFDGVSDETGRLYADILIALAEQPRTIEELSAGFELPPDVIRDAVRSLADRGLVQRSEEGWTSVGAPARQ